MNKLSRYLYITWCFGFALLMALIAIAKITAWRDPGIVAFAIIMSVVLTLFAILEIKR